MWVLGLQILGLWESGNVGRGQMSNSGSFIFDHSRAKCCQPAPASLLEGHGHMSWLHTVWMCQAEGRGQHLF